VSDPVAGSAPDRILIAVGGGYLRNPVRKAGVTCPDCATPVDGYERCYPCNSYRSRTGLADATAFLTYAVAGQESGHLMRGYKALRPVDEHRRVVGLLVGLALRRHAKCAGILAGLPVTHWATVPSLPAKPGEHPLRSLVAGQAFGTEVTLVAAARVQQPRTVNPDHFTCGISLATESHVLVIDDTWATGGHAQSATLALRRAGASRVSVLVVARWLREDYKDNKQFIDDLRTRDYNPSICPWTGAGCP
jgi:hypothetical protein